jgi:uncharacterized protein (TIRG00374 family)
MRSFALRLLVSLAAVAALFYFIDLDDLRRLPLTLRPAWAVLVLALCTADRLMMAWKWRFLLLAGGVATSLSRLLKIYYIGNFFGTFLPSTVGVDALRSWKLTREEGKGMVVLSSVVLERILGFLALATFAAVSLLALSLLGEPTSKAIVAVNLGALLTAALIFIVSVQDWPWLRGRLEKSRLGPLRKLGALHDTYRQFGKSRATLLLFFAASMVEVMIPVAGTWAAARALSLDAGFGLFVLVVPGLLLISRIPISLDGIGIQEGAAAFLFSRFGLPPEAGLALGVTTRVLNLLATTPGLWFYLREPKPQVPACAS